MLRAMIRARMRARLHQDERGFTIIETVIAVTVIFGSLTALAYTATAGFGYQDAARQRQTANGLANQLMERVRGLTTTQITMGLLSTDLTDSRITGGNFYPVSGCTAGSPPGCTESIVSSPAQASFPLNKHLWCSATSQTLTINNVPYSCGTYVTRDTSVTDAPYRITIILTWTSGASGPNKIVRLQSLFTSPPGCTSSTNHPYPGPCQGFFSLQATVPSVDVNIARTSGTSAAGATTFTTGDLHGPGVTATEQTEQSSGLSATLNTAAGTMTGASVPSVGDVTVNAAADDNPDTSITVDSGRQRCGTEFTCTVTASPTLSSASGNSISMTVPATSGESDGSTTSGGVGITSVCPTAANDIDTLPCAGATGATGTSADLSANLTMNSPTPGWGTFSLAKLANPSTATVYVDRQFSTGYGCTSPLATVGCVGGSATRSLGTVTIGDLPALASWSKRPASWNNGFLTITNYADSAAAAVGSGASQSLPTIAGTLKCWNGGQAGAYVTYADLKSSALNSIGPSTCTYSDFIGTGVDKKTITITLLSATAGTVSPTTATSGTLTSALAQAVGPTVTVRYQVIFSGVSASNDVDLTITMTPGTTKVQGSYVAAPAGP